MKKFFVFLTAVALVCGFGIPAMAADEAPAWNFYGSARMATWYSNTSEERAGSFGAYANIGSDDSGTIWELQGNSRFGATVKGDTIGGGFEYGTGVNLRKLYGTYTVGAHEFLVGQTYTPLAYRFYSNQSYATDDGLLGVGNYYTGRDPMLQWKMGGLRVALVKPQVDALGFASALDPDPTDDIEPVTDADSVIPQLEARYVYKTDAFALDVFGGANTYKLEEPISGEDDTVTAYMLGIGAETNFGPGYVKAQIWADRNGAQLGAADWGGNNSASVFEGGINDNDGLGAMAVLGFKATDALVIEGGIGYTSYELDAGDFEKDETIAYYINAIIDIVPGFFIVPEFGYYDFKENNLGVDEGSETYFGAKWQINF
jgi:hypothetical protein